MIWGHLAPFCADLRLMSRAAGTGRARCWYDKDNAPTITGIVGAFAIWGGTEGQGFEP